GGREGVGGPEMHPVLRGVVVERQQLIKVVGDLRDSLGKFGPVGGLERFHRRAGAGLVLGPQISARAFFAPGCADFGSAARTLAVLWNQRRPSLACGNTSRRPFQNPSAPSPTASTGARMPRRARSRSPAAPHPAAARDPTARAHHPLPPP